MKVYYLVIAILIALMLWRGDDKGATTITSERVENNAIDGELNGVESVFFTPQGEKLYFLESKKFSYSTNQAQVNSGPIRLVYTVSANKIITLTSDSSKILDDGDIVELGGEVLVQNLLSDTGTYELANTHDLVINIPKNIAFTDAYTVIKQHHQTLSGNGLEIDLQEGKMKLLRNVQVQNAQ